MNQELSLDTILLVKILKNKNSAMYQEFVSVYDLVKPLLNQRISYVFKDYTLHDVNHSLRIMDYMGKLVPDIEALNELELLVLIYSALLHDIGMAASEIELEEIKTGIRKYKNIDFNAVLEKFDGDMQKANQDFVRRVHGIRSAEYIKKNLKDKLIIPSMSNTGFEEQVALICQAHTEDISWIKNNLDRYIVKGSYSLNPQFYAVILRLADILDFDSQRTPPILYDSLNLNGISKEEWDQHFFIENMNKVKVAQDGNKLIELHGRCTDPYIHRKILSYIGWINEEIENANNITQVFSQDHKLLIHPKVQDFIKSEGYTIADMKFRVSYDQVTKLLMGEELYGEKKYGLRELIQNSIDACQLKLEELSKKAQFGDDEYIPEVKIILDKKNNQIIIKDNGIGMDLNILKKYFLKLGASYYKSDDYLLKGYNYKPIGNYGIGFLACFMLSSDVVVKTRHLNDPVKYEVELSKYDEYVCINHNQEPINHGTEVILNYKEFFKVWDDLEDLKTFLNNYFITDNINITYVNKDLEKKEKIENKLIDSNDHSSIKLSNYLNGIEGQVKITGNPESIFARDFVDLSFTGDPMFYNGKELVEIDEASTTTLTENLLGYELYMLDVPLIEHGSDFDVFFEYFEYNEEGFSMFEERHDPIYLSIIASPDLMEETYSGFFGIHDEILPDLDVADLIELGHDEGTETYVRKRKKILYHIKGQTLYLPVDHNKRLPFSFPNKDKLFIRDIYVTDFFLDLPNTILNLTFSVNKVNIIDNDVIANVTRNNLQKEKLNEIKTVIYQAILFHVYEQLTDEIHKLTVLNFIKEFHSLDTPFLRKKYSQLLKI